MSSRKNKILLVNKTRDFACIGPECPDTCCAGWSVPVDGITLERWKHHPDYPKIKKNLAIINNEDSSSTCAAYITQNDNTSACSFLDSNRLCSLHVSYGPDFLVNTCKKYPRVESSIDGILEKSYALSCPVAANLQLTSKDGLDLEIADSEEVAGPYYRTIINSDVSGFNPENRLSLRMLSLEITQNRNLSVASRLTLLGIFSEALQHAVRNRTPLKACAAEYRKLSSEASDESLHELFIKAPNSFEIKQSFLLLLLDTLMPFAKNHPIYNTFFGSWVSGIKLDLQNKTFDIHAYKKCRNRFLKEFRYEYILENFLFHKVFSLQFPILTGSPLQEFFEIALSYCLIREHIISMYQNDATVSEADIVLLIQSYTKNYDHNEALREKIKLLLEENLITTLAHFCILIRD
jgi:lysine-N-methylase